MASGSVGSIPVALQNVAGGIGHMAEPEDGVRTVAEAYLTLLRRAPSTGSSPTPDRLRADHRGAPPRPGARLAMPEPFAVPRDRRGRHGARLLLASGRRRRSSSPPTSTANALMGLLNAARDTMPICSPPGARRSPRRAGSGRTTCRSTRQECTTRAACCAGTSNGLWIALRRQARADRRPGARDRTDPARRPGLCQLAARGAGGADRPLAHRQAHA